MPALMLKTLFSLAFQESYTGARPPVTSFLNVAYNQNPQINSQNIAVKVKSLAIFGLESRYVNVANAKVILTRNGATRQYTYTSKKNVLVA